MVTGLICVRLGVLDLKKFGNHWFIESKSFQPSFMSLPFSQAAVTTLDHRVLSKMKRLNALKHTTQTYQHRLEELKMEYQRMKPEGSSGAQSADVRARRREEDAMVVISGSCRD